MQASREGGEEGEMEGWRGDGGRERERGWTQGRRKEKKRETSVFFSLSEGHSYCKGKHKKKKSKSGEADKGDIESTHREMLSAGGWM